MPQFRILIVVVVDAKDFSLSSHAGETYVSAMRERTPGAMIRDARVLKIEEVSPPSLAVPDLANTGD